MPGITWRAVIDLHLEAIKALYLADADITEDYKGGVTVGPYAPDPDTGIVSITPRMINLMIAPNASFEPGVSGVNNTVVPIVVCSFEPANAIPYASGSPNVTPYGRMEYLQKKLSLGSEADGTGKLLNPDDPTNPNTTIRYLNVTAPEFRTHVMGRIVQISEKQKSVARLFAFIAIYETRLANVTRQRA